MAHEIISQFILFIHSFPGSQSELIELLQKQLNEKDAEIKRLKASKLVYKRPIKHILQEVLWFKSKF